MKNGARSRQARAAETNHNLWRRSLPPHVPSDLPDRSATQEDRPLPPGPALYVVATPIGNLEDITLRALRVLRQVDAIACEDTRQTQKLLNHYGINTRSVSYHEHNEITRAPELIVDLENGARLAVVTDAGMPGISDPGFRLISLAIRHRIPVVPIPGASAFLSALVASGLPTDSFRFSGFLPSKRNQRRHLLDEIKNSPRTQVFYEAPHRIEEALEDVVERLGGSRHVVIAREVTKLYEEFLRGRADEVLEQVRARPLKGEITLLIGKAEEASEEEEAEVTPITVRGRVDELMAAEQLDQKTALKRVARELGISKSAAYRELQKTQDSDSELISAASSDDAPTPQTARLGRR
ncbi:MAG: 16S rRNA (cytidine(1402)-2'-O)-methyltransferase [Deltaproteobacteria bacterium]